MKKRIFSAIFFVALTLIVLIATVTTSIYYASYSSSQVNQLKEESQLVIRGVELNGESYFDKMTFDKYRITWIQNDGTVKYDSSNDMAELENHLEREEVQEALNTGYGEARRFSQTILEESFYVAYKITDGSIVRLSYTQNSVFLLIIKTLYPLYVVIFATLVVAIILAFALSKKIINPLNKLDLENPDNNKAYPEIQPLLDRIYQQREQLLNDKNEIEKASLLRQDFTANVSHEMKTPLHVIAGYSELLKEGLVKEDEIKDFSSKINFESYRLTKLVDDILQLSKLDNGVLDEEKKDISLDSIIENVVDSLQSVAEEKRITIRTRLDNLTIYGAPNIIHSMFYNLIDNAIKYNKENGTIDVALENEHHHVTVTITDTGIGIPEEQIDRVFERFYRVDKSHSREIGGTGLGLSIVKHAAIVHKAKINVESTLGEGTSFRIIF